GGGDEHKQQEDLILSVARWQRCGSQYLAPFDPDACVLNGNAFKADNTQNFRRCEKKSSTPAGWHICRNGWQRSRTPLGWGSSTRQVLQICHPAGVGAFFIDQTPSMSAHRIAFRRSDVFLTLRGLALRVSSTS